MTNIKTKKIKSTKSSEEISFFEHIGSRVDLLAKAYRLALEDLKDFNLIDNNNTKISATNENENQKVNVNYTIVLNRLNRAINDFKREMRLSLNDYYMLKDIGAVNQYAAKHIEGKLKDLHDKYKKFNTNIPEDILKKGLGSNYNFHKNLKKFTVEMLLEYFETNYLLHMEKEDI